MRDEAPPALEAELFSGLGINADPRPRSFEKKGGRAGFTVYKVTRVGEYLTCTHLPLRIL